MNLTSDGSSRGEGSDDERVDEHIEGLEGDFSLSGGGRGRDGPDPREEFGPSCFRKFDSSEDGQETGSCRSCLAPIHKELV